MLRGPWKAGRRRERHSSREKWGLSAVAGLGDKRAGSVLQDCRGESWVSVIEGLRFDM